jgi:hypothetical protein
LIDQQRQISQISQSLIVRVAGNSPAFGLGLVGKLQTRVSQVAIRQRQLSAGAMNAPVLEVTPRQS